MPLAAFTTVPQFSYAIAVVHTRGMKPFVASVTAYHLTTYKHFCTYPGNLSFINANISGAATSESKSEPLSEPLQIKLN